MNGLLLVVGVCFFLVVVGLFGGVELELVVCSSLSPFSPSASITSFEPPFLLE